MKATMKVDENKNVKGFAIECGAVEYLLLHKAIRMLLATEYIAEADKRIARKMDKDFDSPAEKQIGTDCGWK